MNTHVNPESPSTGAIGTIGLRPLRSIALAAVVLMIAALLVGLPTPAIGTQSADAMQTTNLKVDLTVLLEGSLEADPLMRTDLNDRGLLPPVDPYGTGEMVQNHKATTVDWVHIEIRDPGDPSVVLAERSGVVRSDGRVVPAGSNGAFRITVPTRSSYHAVVFHKSHLPISTPDLVVSNNTLAFDFRTSATTPWPGVHQVIPFNDGRYAMATGNAMEIIDGTCFAGDDYAIDADDLAAWQACNGLFDVYESVDFDMDGDINGADKILVVANQGFQSGIPS